MKKVTWQRPSKLSRCFSLRSVVRRGTSLGGEKTAGKHFFHTFVTFFLRGVKPLKSLRKRGRCFPGIGPFLILCGPSWLESQEMFKWPAEEAVSRNDFQGLLSKSRTCNMKNFPDNSRFMGRVCKRGHSVTGDNAIPKRIAGRIYQQCRSCENMANRERKRFLKSNPQLLIKSTRSGQMSVA